MTAINANNQIVKFDYPIKDLQENVQLKQKELSHELDSTPLKREIYYGKNEVVAREPLKLDKESIVSLQEENSSLKSKQVFRLGLKHGYIKDGILHDMPYSPESKLDRRNLFRESFIKVSTLDEVKSCFKEKIEFMKSVFDFPRVGKLRLYELKITDTKAFFYTEDYSGSGDLKLYYMSEIYQDEEDENVFHLRSGFCLSDKNKYGESSISLQEAEEYCKRLEQEAYWCERLIEKAVKENQVNTTEKDILSSSSSHFLDEYLKQKDISIQFLVHQLIDNKLLKNLNLIV